MTTETHQLLARAWRLLSLQSGDEARAICEEIEAAMPNVDEVAARLDRGGEWTETPGLPWGRTCG